MAEERKQRAWTVRAAVAGALILAGLGGGIAAALVTSPWQLRVLGGVVAAAAALAGTIWVARVDTRLERSRARARERQEDLRARDDVLCRLRDRPNRGGVIDVLLATSTKAGGTIPAAVKTEWSSGSHLPRSWRSITLSMAGLTTIIGSASPGFVPRPWIGIITSRDRWDTPAPVWVMTEPLFHPGARHRLWCREAQANTIMSSTASAGGCAPSGCPHVWQSTGHRLAVTSATPGRPSLAWVSGEIRTLPRTIGTTSDR